tara:strand:- start:124 stop:1140 length:1017 start_codon:yes stop_codon:yes gene_type:complete
MAIKILVDVPVISAALQSLEATGKFSFDVIDPPEETARPLDAQCIADAEVLFCTYPPTNFEDMKAVKWVQISSAGYTQLFDHNLPARGVRATNGRGCFDVPIAEWNVAMMVNLARDMRQLVLNQEVAVWDRSEIFQREIRGMVVGIWGYGGIGRETARLAQTMGLKIHVFARNGVGPRGDVYHVPGTSDPEGVLPDRVFTDGDELEFLSGLDFLVLGLPLTKQTEGLIGERELRALPDRAYILNPARGPIIQEQALIKALSEKWIAGAALDTHYHYPMPPEHPLWKMPNVIMTPHISGSSLSPSFLRHLWDIFTANAERYAAGKPLLNELTPEQLAGS